MGVIVDDTPEVHEMAQGAPADPSVPGATPINEGPSLPVIDPRTLSRAQQDGMRCAVPNCQRLLAAVAVAYQVGRLPTGEPVLACEECGPDVSYEVAHEFETQGMIPEQRRWRPRLSSVTRGPRHGQAA
jgi:hypothetical protein